MRGIALVLTVAFVFASSALLVGPASAQASEPDSKPAYPDDYRQEPTDAVIQGRVLDAAGNPVAGATVSSYNYGPVYATESEDPSSGSSSGSSMAYPYYGGNSTTTAADGSYRLGVYSGENQVSVYRDGYASSSAQVPVGSGQTVTKDLTVQKFPDKTARLEGRVTDLRTGKGISFASISVSNPWYGTYECSLQEGQASGGGSEPRPMSADSSTSIVAPDYYYPNCAITVHSDGTFEGLVTPGYSIVSVYAYADCFSSMDSDGSSSNSCGPQYFAFARTLTLPANETTEVNAALRSHPSPDSRVSGYLVDAESGQAIPGAQISFSNQETYGYGYATTDGDGSYSLRLRSGYHMVSVWAPGHLPWEGTLLVEEGASDFDVKLTPGEPAYGGGCCYAYAEKGGVAMGVATDTAVAPAPGGNVQASDSDDGSGDTTQEVLYEDLGGGLGPYDASKRSADLEDSPSNGAPGLGLFAVLGAIVVALVALRRRA